MRVSSMTSVIVHSLSLLLLLHGGGSHGLDKSDIYFDPEPFTDSSYDGQFLHMVVDPTTSRVYVGAVNRLYQLSSTLELEKSVTLGPRDDNPNCPPRLVECEYEEVETDSYIKSLLIDNRNAILLVCTNLQQGHCQKRRLHDITIMVPSAYVPVVPSDQSSSVYMFIGPGYPEPSSTLVLYVGARRPGNSEILSAFKDLIPAVCSRNLSNFELVYNDNIYLQATKIEIEAQQRDMFFVDYIYGFSSGGFTYFLTVQRKSVVGQGSSDFVTRVLRVCQNDRTFSSYTELPLECHHNGTSYNILQAATLTTVAPDLASRLGISHTNPADDVLFASFARSEPESRDPLHDSVLCVYTMRSIQTLFTRTIQRCFRGIGNTGPAHYGVVNTCRQTSLTIGDDYCGEIEFNKPVAGTEPVSQQAVTHFPGNLITSLAVTKIFNLTVALLGNSVGVIKKVVVDSGTSAEQYEEVVVDPGKSINADMVLSDQQQHQHYLYVMTDQKVTRMKLHECGQYTTCSQCLGARDPFCGWCSLDNKCSLMTECAMAVYPLRWLSHKNAQCTRITEVIPRMVQISQSSPGQDTRRLQISVQYLPALRKEEYNCVFSGHGVTRTTAVTNIDPLQNSTSRVWCKTPKPNLLPARPTGKDHIVMRLSLRRGQIDFVETNFTFFDCSVYHTCSGCTASAFPCTWCIRNHRCTHNAEVCLSDVLVTGQNVPGSSDRIGPAACPRIESDESEILVPSGKILPLTLSAHNLQDFQHPLHCIFDISETKIVVNASFVSNTIRCAEVKFMYAGNEAMERNVPFEVVWGNVRQNLALDHPNKEMAQVKMYKCSAMGGSCGACLVVQSKYNCGWCSSNQSCLVEEECAHDNAQWLDSTQTCPNPTISHFSPSSGPTAGGTNVTIHGRNLGKSAADINDSLSVANIPCHKAIYETASRIICVTGWSPVEVSGQVRVVVADSYTAQSSEAFSYVKPRIVDIHPKRGPFAGGTLVTISGEHINAGTKASALIGGLPCLQERMTANEYVCMTSFMPGEMRNSAASSELYMTFDNGSMHYNESHFLYMSDPSVVDVSPKKGIMSGTTSVTVKGTNLNIVQQPQLVVYTPEEQFETACDTISDTILICDTPDMSHIDFSDGDEDVSRRKRRRRDTEDQDPSIALLNFGLIMDNVTSLRNLSEWMFTLYPDPTFTQFEGIKNLRQDTLIINGENFDLVLNDNDIQVTVGGLACNVTSVSHNVLMCTPPKLPESGEVEGEEDNSFVVSVSIGRNKTFYIGRVQGQLQKEAGSGSEVVPSILTVPVIIAMSVSGGIMLIIIIGIYVAYRRKSQESDLVMKRMQNQMDVLEARVAKECKEAFAELQTEMTDLTSDLGGLAGIPFREYRSICMKVLFPSFADNDHPVTRPFECENEGVERGLRQFNQLIGNKIFLLLFIRTLEARRDFVARDKVNVASLVSAALQNRMEYHTDILKTLLAELIEKSMEGRSHPKLLLRRTESVAEKMLTNWLTFLLVRFLKECAGEPLFLLFRAVKQQVDKGPVDAQTSEARYSLSEDKLIRQQIDYKTMTIYVIDLDIKTNGPEVPVKVLDCDTIAQVKEKILDAVYKNFPFSMRPTKEELDLEWHTGDQGRLILSDEDKTSKFDGEHKRLNTLAHYRVPDGAVIALVPKQTMRYNISHASDRSLPRYDVYNSNSPSLSRSLSPNTINIDMDSTSKVYHLVKHHDNDPHKEGERGSKMVSEVYLTRLLATKGTLQQFVDDLFETIFSTATRGSVLPLAIKYMFDFLDDQALQHAITDPEVVHTWKSNSLPLRFWVNVVKNPDFVFDVSKSNIVDSCLSVVAQTFMDSCSMSEHRLGKDSPSSKLLYAKDIPKYKKWVERYYQDIKQMPAISDQDMNAMLAEESRLHQNEFNLNAALHELYLYVSKYNREIMEILEDDEFARNYRLASRLDQVHNLMNSSYA